MFKKTATLLAICSVLLLNSSSVTFAQIIDCSSASLDAYIQAPDDTIEVSDIFSANILISNRSPLYLSDIRVGAALFSPDDSETPLYWVFSDQPSISYPTTETKTTLTASLQAVEPGSYNVKVAAVQGNNTDLLGKLIKQTDTYPLIKSNKATDVPSISIEVEEEVNKFDPNRAPKLLVLAKTSHDKENFVLRDSELLLVISEGAAPLGSAVVSEVTDSVAIFPNTDWETKVEAVEYYNNEISVYAALSTGGIMQPIEKATINLNFTNQARSWSYMSTFGSIEKLQDSNSTFVTCVEAFNEDLGVGFVQEESMVKLTLINPDPEGDNTDLYSKISSDNSFIFNTNSQGDVDVELSLYQLKYNLNKFDKALIQEGNEKAALYLADKVELNLFCDSPDCYLDEGVDQKGSGDSSMFNSIKEHTYSFYYYMGIIIAASLLMYLMLHRLGPEEEKDPEEEMTVPDEA